MISKVIVCPICGKKTFLRIQDGGYLDEYPIRVNCYNCRALLKGVYIMRDNAPFRGLYMLNASVEECQLDTTDPQNPSCTNADYVAEVSGELPCNHVKKYEGGLPESPYMRIAINLDSMTKHIERLKYFNGNMQEWRQTKSTAFQLLDDGSIDYIATALGNKMGSYPYECNNYMKSLQCLQEVVLEETKDLFISQDQDDCIKEIIHELAQVDKEKISGLADRIGGVHGLIVAYRKTIEVFSEFMNIYPNLLPAETYEHILLKEAASTCIATCSFIDLKTYYQDAYEALLSLLYIPVGLDNITIRNDYQHFSDEFNSVYCKNGKRDFSWYSKLDNGTRINKLGTTETFQRLIEFPANRLLRNGIGHNNIQYDSIMQTITAFDLKKPNKIDYQDSLMNVAIACLGLAKTAVIFSEIILYMLRAEFRAQGVRSMLHPRFYRNVQPNDKCPCGSGLKYKKCCKNDVEAALRKK